MVRVYKHFASQFGSILTPFELHFGLHFGYILAPFGAQSAPKLNENLIDFWYEFGSIWPADWLHFASIWAPFGLNLELILAPFLLHFGALGAPGRGLPFCFDFGSLFRCFSSPPGLPFWLPKSTKNH